jgi:DNA sulfur modification protein DndD
MILQEIVLYNFRVYRDRNLIKLEPPSPKKPIILIGGLNGGGKTSLLMALQLVLFGRAANVWRSTCTSYDEFLRKSIHRAVPPEDGAGIELQFRHVHDGEEQTVRILRYWRVAGQSVRETVEVLRDGEFDAVASEHWSEWVEDFIPPRISPLFFFDGEKIEELADPEQSIEVLSTAIQSLLGLDLVDQLSTDLKVFERRRRKDLTGKQTQFDFEALETERDRAEDTLTQKSQASASAETEVRQLEKRVQEVEKELNQHGGSIYAQAADLRLDQARIKKQKKEAEEKLQDLANGCLPFLLCGETLAAYRKVADQESSSSFSGAVLNDLEERDDAVLKAVQGNGAATKTITFLRKFLAHDVDARRVDLDNSDPVLHLSMESTHRLRHLLDAELPAAATAALDLTKQIEKRELRIDSIDRKLAGLPDEETVQPLLAKQKELAAALTKVAARRDILGEQLEQTRRQCEQHEQELEKCKRKDEETLQDKDDDHRLLFHSQRARRTLETFRDRILAKHIARIESLVLESFQSLLRKQRLVQDLHIDPKTYRISIQDQERGLVDPESLSAGERQLLATSLLWGLSRASGRRLPVVIDTPLGRLDNSHRSNLIDRYFPHASHQVILLSTDEEIDSEFAEQIEPRVGRKYTLDFDDELQATTASEGYFW